MWRRAAVAALWWGWAVGCKGGSGSAPVEVLTPADAGRTASGGSAVTRDGSAVTSPAGSPGAPANALGMSSADIETVVNPMHLPPYAGPTGAVEGTVLVRGPDAPDVPNLDVHACPAALDTYGKLFRAGARRPDGARAVADAVVVVTGYEGAYLPEKSEVHRETIGANCGYPTRTIAMTFGQRLEIANDSPLAFAPFIEGGFQLSAPVAPPRQHGAPVKIFPPRADHFPLKDELQTFVHEDLLVLRQPLHAVTDRAGHFRIEGVPAGKRRVDTRLMAIPGEAGADVDVRAGETARVELTLKYEPR
ncbi:MAG: carboxypeptidase regulatory-like domain-containing protein [Myxococcales bacterium]|nr:carboxypeptidase regulatory-like domain-containing protein [Myxococcales bacterium]